MLGRSTFFTEEQAQDCALANRDIVESEIMAFKSIHADESAEHCLGLPALEHPQYHPNLLRGAPLIHCPHLPASRAEPSPDESD